MTLPTVGTAAFPTQNDIRDSILRGIKYSFDRRGEEANILPGSDHFIRAENFAGQVAIAIANGRIAETGFNPNTATGEDLTELLTIFGVPELEPAAATGYMVIGVTSGTVTVPVDFTLTIGAIQYKTTSTSVGLADGAKVQVIATTTGEATDQDAAASGTWDSAAIGNLKAVTTVDVGGLTGGRDEEGPEQKRERLLNRIAFPQGGGNWAQVRQYALDSSASITGAYVYGPVRGPAAYDVAVLSSEADRSVTTAVRNATASYILGRMPGCARLNITTAAEQQMDIVLSASLPLPTSAGGAGGGWRDASPWPAENAKITAYNSGTGVATVNSTATPVAGNNIGVWDWAATTPVMREYVVASGVGGISGAWTFTVVGGFSTTPLGAYVSAGAVNLTDYADEFAALLLTLGPGEKTSNVDILKHGRRRPGPDVEDPADLTNQLLRRLLASHPELLDLSYGARYLTGTTTTQTTPSVSTTTADPPNVFTLKHLAIRKA